MFKVGDVVKLKIKTDIDISGYSEYDIKKFLEGYDCYFTSPLEKPAKKYCYIKEDRGHAYPVIDVDSKGRIGLYQRQYLNEVYFEPYCLELVLKKSQVNETKSAQELTKLEYAALALCSAGWDLSDEYVANAVKTAKKLLEACNE